VWRGQLRLGKGSRPCCNATPKTEGDGWALKDQEGGVVITFKSKAEATSGGEFEKAIGATGCAFTKKTAP
jgi:hypothetical protein